MTASPERADYAALTHGEARGLWGLPDEQEGSVNDPRASEEHGIRFNEKWTYLLHGGGRRFVYWYRYDCRGVRVEDAAGAAREPAG